MVAEINVPITAIDDRRTAAAAATPAADGGSVTTNTPKTTKDVGVQNFDSNGQPTQPSGDTTITADTAALKQKNVLHENGPAGDSTASNSIKAFGNAVASAGSLLAKAAALKNKPQPLPSAPARNKTDNYYLTEAEKALLYKKAREFAGPGIVPYDVLEQFLFILVTIDNYNDLSYIAKVVGVEDLDDPLMVREPMKILYIKDLSKVGYMANAVAAINKQFSAELDNARYLNDPASNPFGPLLAVGSYAASPIGACAASSNSTYTAELLGLPESASQAIEQKLTIDRFPLSDVAADMVSQIIGGANLLGAITSLFGTISGFGGVLGQIAQLASCGSALTSIINSSTSLATFLEKTGVGQHFPIANQLKEVIAKGEMLSEYINMLSNVTTVAGSPRNGDIVKQLSKIATMKVEIDTLLQTILSACQSATGPGNCGAAAANLTKVGGFALSGILAELTMGQRLPATIINKNPTMQEPSFIGKAYFGEAPTARLSVEQIFCKRIACYPQESCGAGVASFGMQNFASMGSPMSLTQMVSKTLTGSTTPPSTGTMATVVAQKASDIANLLNVSTDQQVEARRSDNAIPYMIAASTVLADQDVCPYDTKVFADGWKMASGVGNDVQRYNPQLLEACQTAL